jgi:hypothetical protein
MTPKLIFLVVVSSFLSLAAILMLLHHQFSRELYVIGSGALIGWTAVAYRGRLPIWMRKRWGIVDESDPQNLPMRIWLPILAVVVAVAGVLIFYAFRF